MILTLILSGSKSKVKYRTGYLKGTSEDADSGMEGAMPDHRDALTLNGTPKDAW